MLNLDQPHSLLLAKIVAQDYKIITVWKKHAAKHRQLRLKIR